MAVQRLTYCTSKTEQNPVAFYLQVLYRLDYSGWMLLSDVEVHLPHNPLVPGSSPGCPTFPLYERGPRY
jgi:hypothetical protein